MAARFSEGMWGTHICLHTRNLLFLVNMEINNEIVFSFSFFPLTSYTHTLGSEITTHLPWFFIGPTHY